MAMQFQFHLDIYMANIVVENSKGTALQLTKKDKTKIVMSVISP
jgi:hypothetical protein